MAELNSVLYVSEESKATMKRLNYPLGIRALFDPQAAIEAEEQAEEENRRYNERMKEFREKYGNDVPF